MHSNCAKFRLWLLARPASLPLPLPFFSHSFPMFHPPAHIATLLSTLQTKNFKIVMKEAVIGPQQTAKHLEILETKYSSAHMPKYDQQ